MDPGGTGKTRMQVDFRYADTCLMLLLDGHVEVVDRFEHHRDQVSPEFEDYIDLENERNIRLLDLTERWVKIRPPEDP